MTDTISCQQLHEIGEIVVPEWSSVGTSDAYHQTYRGTILKSRDKRRHVDGEGAAVKPSLGELVSSFCSSSSKLRP